MRLSEAEEKDKWTEKIFETIMTMNFSKWMLSIKPQIQEGNT